MMRKFILLACLTGLIATGISQPRITDVRFPSSVAVFDLFEITFHLGEYANPYDPEVIDVTAEFTGPDGQIQTALGFYYEAYRFTKTEGYESKIHPRLCRQLDVQAIRTRQKRASDIDC